MASLKAHERVQDLLSELLSGRAPLLLANQGTGDLDKVKDVLPRYLEGDTVEKELPLRGLDKEGEEPLIEDQSGYEFIFIAEVFELLGLTISFPETGDILPHSGSTSSGPVQSSAVALV